MPPIPTTNLNDPRQTAYFLIGFLLFLIALAIHLTLPAWRAIEGFLILGALGFAVATEYREYKYLRDDVEDR